MGIETSYTVGPGAPPVREMTVVDLLREAADAAPDRVGMIAGVADTSARREWTFRELLDDSVRVARAPRALRTG